MPPTALVTGASTGIGYELAKLFAADKYNLVLVARSRDRLEKVAAEILANHGVEVKVIAQDLSEPGAPVQLLEKTVGGGATVDILVNNAGFGTFGHFSQSGLAAQLAMMQVNIASLTMLTRLFLDDMLLRKRGRILNVASTAAFQAGPLMAVYYASKAYVLSFSEALANELKGTGVTVTCLCPGPTATEFHERAKMMDSRLLIPTRMSVARVARIGYRGLMCGKTLVIPGMHNWVLAQVVRLVPRRTAAWIVRVFQERRG